MISTMYSKPNINKTDSLSIRKKITTNIIPIGTVPTSDISIRAGLILKYKNASSAPAMIAAYKATSLKPSKSASNEAKPNVTVCVPAESPSMPSVIPKALAKNSNENAK